MAESKGSHQLSVCSNDGYHIDNNIAGDGSFGTTGTVSTLEVTSAGLCYNNRYIFVYVGDKVFKGFATSANATEPTYTIGSTFTFGTIGATQDETLRLYVVESYYKFDLSTLNLSAGTHKITVKARANGYLDSIEGNEDIYYVYAGESEILQPPTILNHSEDGIDVVDNPSNGNETIGYAVYTKNDEYVCFRAKTGQSMHIKKGSGMVGGEYVYVRAIDKNAKASKESNVALSGECFVAGTPISMADGTYKMIEEVQVGDQVKSYNFKTSTYCTGIVTKVATGYTTRIAMVLFEDGNYVAMSEGHPLYTQDGWHSITNKNGYPTLVIGDKVLGKSTYVAIQDIQVVDTEPTIVYSLGVTVSNGEDMFDGTYFAGIGMTLATHGGGSN